MSRIVETKDYEAKTFETFLPQFRESGERSTPFFIAVWYINLNIQSRLRFSRIVANCTIRLVIAKTVPPESFVAWIFTRKLKFL